MSEYMGVLWLVAVIGFVVLEASTVQFVSIWFAGGALVSLVMFLVGASVSAQVLGFAIASLILLICTRPFVKKMTKNTDAKTNFDLLIGKTALVTSATDSFGENGEARISGKYWSVKSEDAESLSEGETVTVVRIEGVKLIVRK